MQSTHIRNKIQKNIEKYLITNQIKQEIYTIIIYSTGMMVDMSSKCHNDARMHPNVRRL